MSRRRTLSDAGVAALKPRAARFAFADPELRGLYVRVQPSGAKSFVAVTRDPAGKQRWTTIGACNQMAIADARDKARAILARVRDGLPAFEERAEPETFGDVTAAWIKRHVEPKGLRSRKEIVRLLDSHVLPEWRDREFVGIRRTDVVRLLDDVEDDHSARQADAVLTIVRSICNWFASRHDDYTPPIVRGMRRQDPKAQARARVLDDGELRAIWTLAETSGSTFGDIVQLALLTAQRLAKVATMRWDDVSLDGVWTITTAPREKGNGGALKLPQAAVEIIRARPRMGDNPYIFAGRRGGAFSGFSASKRTFDAKLPADMPRWVIHDLRRTARSIMSRAGVRPDVAERVMGHAIAGVEAVYDRHAYFEEKADALARLAALIEGIAHPSANVVPLRAAE